MSRKDMNRSNLELQLTHPTGTSEDEGIAATFTLRDRTSNKTIALMELTVEDFHAIMCGRSRQDMRGVSYLAVPSDLAKLRHTRLNVTRVLTSLPYSEDQGERLDAWVAEAAQWMGTDEGRWSRSNGGAVTVTLTFYVAPFEASDADRLESVRAGFTQILEGLNTRALGVNWKDQ